MLDCTGDLGDLAKDLIDIESVSGGEGPLAQAVWDALSAYPHLSLTRVGNTVVARTEGGAPQRVAIAGHLDTVPVAGNLPARTELVDGRTALIGRGACDMKGGVAVQLYLAATCTTAPRELTWIFYDNEEVEAAKSGLGRLARERPDLMEADLAILMEPSGGAVEAGCQGSLRCEVVTHGLAAHSARSWLGHNAIHDMGPVLRCLEEYESHEVVVDGLTYREGLNAVGISGGVAGNVIPDTCRMSVNYRFAPDKTVAQASAIVRDIFSGYELVIRDAAPAARPGLDQPLVASLVAGLGRAVRPKLGWTDVARFAELGIPAVNFGPGDPNQAHTDGEFVFLDDILACRDDLGAWLAAR